MLQVSHRLRQLQIQVINTFKLVTAMVFPQTKLFLSILICSIVKDSFCVYGANFSRHLRDGYADRFRSCQVTQTEYPDRRFSASEIRIATWNVKFLFLKNLRDTRIDCPGEGCEWKNLDMANYHFQLVAQIIYNMQVDILILQEVEDCDALKELAQLVNQISVRTTGHSDFSYRSFLISGGDIQTGQNVGMLTRFDPSEELSFIDYTQSYIDPQTNSLKTATLAKNVIARFEFPGYSRNITLISAHLVARPTNPSRRAKQEAQSKILQRAVADYPDDEIILLGDFNARSGNVPDVRATIPYSDAMHNLESIIHRGRHLRHAAQLVHQNYRFTHWSKRGGIFNFDSVDHILLSRGLYNHVSQVQFSNSYIHHVQAAEQYYHSDHFPLIVALKTTSVHSNRI